MNIEDIKTPEDILKFMQSNIRYGWLDINKEEHIGNMKDFRRLYRTSSIDEVLSHGIGTCIEQVYLMSMLLKKLNIPNRMFCTRIYEDENFNDMDEEEHMHCFVLYELNGKVYQIEHPNWTRVGIYEFDNFEKALKETSDYYQKREKKSIRKVTEFYEVEPNLSFKDFNCYINSLDKDKVRK